MTDEEDIGAIQAANEYLVKIVKAMGQTGTTADNPSTPLEAMEPFNQNLAAIREATGQDVEGIISSPSTMAEAFTNMTLYLRAISKAFGV